MEPEGITRACTIVPVINRNARITHSQETASRTTSLPSVGFGGFISTVATGTAGIADNFSSSLIWGHLNFRDQRFFAVTCARLEFGLRSIHWIITCVTGSSIISAGILNRAA